MAATGKTSPARRETHNSSMMSNSKWGVMSQEDDKRSQSTMLENNYNLQAGLMQTTQSDNFKGENFKELYALRRLRQRVANHEGIKKLNLTSGDVKKNAFKIYHYKNAKLDDQINIQVKKTRDMLKNDTTNSDLNKAKGKGQDKIKDGKTPRSGLDRSSAGDVNGSNYGGSMHEEPSLGKLSEDVFEDDQSSALSYIDNNQKEIGDKQLKDTIYRCSPSRSPVKSPLGF